MKYLFLLLTLVFSAALFGQLTSGYSKSEAAELMKITARELKELGVIERVIPETFRGEPLTQAAIVKRLKADLIYKLKELSSKELPELLEARYQRFRKY